MKILFIDPVCNKPYDPQVLETEPLGGTEATVIRIAEALGRAGHEVMVKQHNRTSSVDGEAQYCPFGYDFPPTHVIVLRAPMVLYQARKQFPTAKLFFWAHDIFSGPGWDKGFQALVDTQAVPIVVSEWHKAQMYDAMRQVGFQGSVPSRRIYNPITDDLQPDQNVVVNNQKLVFFSSPHKGLERTLEVFARFKDFDELRDMKLYIANPGYLADHNTEGLRNVVNLGALPHKDVLLHVRSSLAVFYLNRVFPETFGIVAAESNAVGTPFLSAKIGALPEVADHPQEFVDVSDNEAVIKRIIAWKIDGRPKVLGNANFRLSRVIREWLDLLRV